MNTLKNRTAVITGAGKGLGKAMALALAEEGANLALVGRNMDLLNQTAQECASKGVTAESFQCDVSVEAQVREMEKAITNKFGKIQILINNAGINLRKNIADFTLDEWRLVLDTNLTGAFLVCRSFIPHMTGQGYGRIINLTSIMSHVSLPMRGAYCASKAGLLGLTRALALELAPEKITVNGISPGPFATEMNLPLMQNPELSKQFISRVPQGRWGDVEDIGKLAVFLCSDYASFLTGTDIVVDGGWTTQ